VVQQQRIMVKMHESTMSNVPRPFGEAVHPEMVSLPASIVLGDELKDITKYRMNH
jgi:hypothetical protein